MTGFGSHPKRTPTVAETHELKAGGWGYHDDFCWHHFDYDIGNEPFTTDEALEACRCPHTEHYDGNHGFVFCVCGKTIKDPRERS